MAGGDGASFDLCVDCGYIVGFDRDAVKAALDELADMSGYDDE
jgi:Fe2+ or Zn2+ uptake regulation protein